MATRRPKFFGTNNYGVTGFDTPTRLSSAGNMKTNKQTPTKPTSTRGSNPPAPPNHKPSARRPRGRAGCLTPERADHWWDGLVPAEKSFVSWLVVSLQRAPEASVLAVARNFREVDATLLAFARSVTQPAPRSPSQTRNDPVLHSQPANLN